VPTRGVLIARFVLMMCVSAASLDCSTEAQRAAPSLHSHEWPTAQAMTSAAQADLHAISDATRVFIMVEGSVADAKTCGSFNY